MGWWPVNFDLTTDDTIGDTPADILDEAFSHIAQRRSHQGEKPPVLQEVLDTLAFLLSTVSADVYEHGRRERIVRLTASIFQEGNPAPVMIDSDYGDTLTKDLTLVLFGALHGICSAYQEAWERLPRLTEILALFAFVLSDETCSSESPFSVQRITATTVQLGVLQMWAESLPLFVKHLARRVLPRRSRQKQRQIAARLRQLEAQIAADVDAHGFSIMGVFDPQGRQPLWGYTIGLHHTNPAFSDVLIIGLPTQKIEGMLRLIADKMLKEQVAFDAGQVCSDLTEGDSPCFFAAVDPTYYEAYVGQGLNYYAGMSKQLSCL